MSGVQPLQGGSLRVDFGAPIRIDRLVVRPGSEHAHQPFKRDETLRVQVSEDLRRWTEVRVAAGDVATQGTLPTGERRGGSDARRGGVDERSKPQV